MRGCIVISYWENYIMILLYTYRTLNMLNSFKHQSNLGTFSSLKKKNFGRISESLKFNKNLFKIIRPCIFISLFNSASQGWRICASYHRVGEQAAYLSQEQITLDHSAERRKLKNTALIAVIKFEVNKTIKIQDRKKLIGKWRFLKLEADSNSPLLWSICSASCTNWFILVLDPKSIIFTSQPACHAPALPLTCSLERKYCTLLGSPHGKSKTVIQYKFC